MPQKLPTFNFEWIEDTSQFNEDFVKNYDEESKVILLRLMLNIPKNYTNATTTYYFYQKERNLENLLTSLEDETEYVTHIKSLKQALNDNLVLKKVHRVISFNQDKW